MTFLNDLFRIDPMSQLNEPTDAYDLIAWIQQAFGYMAMVDYPYPSSFITPLPGWPVNYACKYAQEEITDPKLAATVLYEMSNVFYNYSGDLPTNCVNYTVCGDTVMNSISAPGTQMSWPWQICTELITEVCSEGPPNDFFSDQCSMYGGPQEQMLISCMWSFWPIGYNEILFDPNAIPIEYGHNYAAASNIIFTSVLLAIFFDLGRQCVITTL
ncbi:unnamed protein product [Toxocara canis]|uniref:Uncharacterized protein n=1 Tax=Toxocara canis TaxID=6265 RepID=A0A3P7HBI8_TOXCA|nr:unnamed protein product [Toxocara canis]